MILHYVSFHCKQKRDFPALFPFAKAGHLHLLLRELQGFEVHELRQIHKLFLRHDI